MTARKWLVAGLAVALVVTLVGGGFLALRAAFFAPTTITAYFPAATAIYPGDDVRVSGSRSAPSIRFSQRARRPRWSST